MPGIQLNTYPRLKDVLIAAVLTTAIWVLSGSSVGKWRQQLAFTVQGGLWAFWAVILMTPKRVSSI